jgi:eukaryotic-like serine/threonine-protein kinase
LPAVKLLDRGGQQRLDRYELVAELASGGMATVFLGRILGAGGFQRFVAIKRLHPHLASEQEFVEMFLDEARLAASIHHPNVVPILEVGTSDRGYYLVMEYIEGDTLARLLARAATSRQRIPIPIVIRIVLDTLAGLHAAHELKDDNDHHLNLVHRDVSPQNILVGINGTARITDFGVARAATRLSSTRSGQLKGKLAYMAPEQARGGQIDRRADLFAVGTVLWEVLADKRLFKGEGEADTLNRVLFEPIPKLRDIDPEIEPVLEAVTMKSLDRDPEKRFPTASVFADELEKAARTCASIASVREVADYVQKVLGQDISQQREAVRAWLAQSEPSRTELDDRDIIVGVGGAQVATTSSSAVSIPPKTISPAQPSSGLLSEITRARRKRRDRILWGGAGVSVLIVGGILVGLPRSDGTEASSTSGSSSATPAASVHASSPPAPASTPPSPATPTVAAVPPPTAVATPPSSAPVAEAPAPPAPAPPTPAPPPRPASKPLPVSQLPPVAPPRPRPPPSRPPTPTPAPPPTDDIPRNPYR